MSFLEYFSLFMSVILGGGVAFYFKQSNQKILKTILSFSGAYIFGITILHFLPSVFNGPDQHIGLYILVGFLIQLVLEQMSLGIEHGHIHVAHSKKNRMAVQVMVGLCVHAFIEGLPLGKYATLMAHDHVHEGNHLLMSIILHKAPAAFALVVLLLLSKFKQLNVVLCMFLFAMMSPLGSLLGEQLTIDAETIRKLLAVVVGSFLHIATTIIFETEGSEHHHFSPIKMLAILIGMGLALLTM